MQIYLNKIFEKQALIFFLVISNFLLSSCSQLPPNDKQISPASARILESNEFNKNYKLEIRYYEDSKKLESALNQIFQETDPALKLEKIKPWLHEKEGKLLSPESQPHIWALLNILFADALDRLSNNTKSDLLDLSIKHYKNALRVISHTNYPLQTAAIQNNLAKILMNYPDSRRNDYLEGAIKHAQQALKIRTQSQFPEDWAQTLIILAKAFHMRNFGDKTSNLEQAANFFEQALEVRSYKRFPDEFLVTIYEFSQVLFELGQYHKAFAYIEAALKINEGRLQQDSLLENVQFLINQAESLFSNAVWAAVQIKDYEKALQLLEWGKGRILRKKLNSDNLDIFQDKNHSFYDSPDIATLYHWLSTFPSDSTIIVPLFSDRGTLVFILPSGIKKIDNNNIIKIEKFTRKDLHALIRGEKNDEWGGYIQTYVDLKIKEAKIHLLQNSKQGSKNTLTEAIQSLELQRNTWKEKVTISLDLFTREWLGQILDRLQNLEIKHHSRLIWIMDSDTSFLPIHSVIFQGQPLLAHYTIHFAPNIYSLYLAYKNLSKRKNDNILTIINPNKDLSWTEIENEFIDFPSKTSLIGSEANLENYHEAIQQYSPGYIHFASHGQYNFRAPLESGLRLSNGMLTVKELFSKPGNYLDENRIVVLSACETSLVDIYTPSESIGIPLSFLQAGAPAVISALWLVEDISTALLMAKFYQLHRIEFLEPAKALAKAQMWLRSASIREINSFLKTKSNVSIGGNGLNENEIPYHDWYYWAGFVYIGM